MMSRVQKGMVAGFVATVVVSLLEAVNLLGGPWFTPFPRLVGSLIGMEGNLVVGWVTHFVVGTVVLGSLFGILCPKLPTDTPGTKGILFAVGAFVLLMLAVFMFGDSSMFRGSGVMGAVFWPLITNMVFGYVLGSTYGHLVAREKRMAKDMGGAAPAH